MIYAVTSGKVIYGAVGNAIEFAKEVSKYYKENHPDINIELLMTRYNGPGNTVVHWVGRHESMGAFDELSKAVREEEGYKSLIEKEGKVWKERGTLYYDDMVTKFYDIIEF